MLTRSEIQVPVVGRPTLPLDCPFAACGGDLATAPHPVIAEILPEHWARSPAAAPDAGLVKHQLHNPLPLAGCKLSRALLLSAAHSFPAAAIPCLPVFQSEPAAAPAPLKPALLLCRMRNPGSSPAAGIHTFAPAESRPSGILYPDPVGRRSLHPRGSRHPQPARCPSLLWRPSVSTPLTAPHP